MVGESPSDPNTILIAGVAGGVGGALLIINIIVIIVVCLRKRQYSYSIQQMPLYYVVICMSPYNLETITYMQGRAKKVTPRKNFISLKF